MNSDVELIMYTKCMDSETKSYNILLCICITIIVASEICNTTLISISTQGWNTPFHSCSLAQLLDILSTVLRLRDSCLLSLKISRWLACCCGEEYTHSDSIDFWNMPLVVIGAAVV